MTIAICIILACLAMGAYLFRNTTDEPARTAYTEPDWKARYFEVSGQAITFKLERDQAREELAALKAPTAEQECRGCKYVAEVGTEPLSPVNAHTCKAKGGAMIERYICTDSETVFEDPRGDMVSYDDYADAIGALAIMAFDLKAAIGQRESAIAQLSESHAREARNKRIAMWAKKYVELFNVRGETAQIDRGVALKNLTAAIQFAWPGETL
jgi:hypothetical protein